MADDIKSPGNKPTVDFEQCISRLHVRAGLNDTRLEEDVEENPNFHYSILAQEYENRSGMLGLLGYIGYSLLEKITRDRTIRTGLPFHPNSPHLN